MNIAAFTYVRNGFIIDYPFIESIKSVLPLVDEFVVVIGDSTDGTRAAVEALRDNRIKIVDTVWDDKMRTGGLIFAQQANIGLDNISKEVDWIFHIQADEIVHENDIPIIKAAMEKYLSDEKTEGLLFKFINFFGDYWHYAPSRRFHQYEIRIIKNNPKIRSYKDSQGFRKFENIDNYLTERGKKLHVRKIDATIYHYSWAKPPKKQKQKQIEFGKRYNQDNDFIKAFEAIHSEGYDYRDFDYLKKFTGTHPNLMLCKVKEQDWVFNYNPSKNNMNNKEKIMKLIEDITGKRLFAYKNYIVI